MYEKEILEELKKLNQRMERLEKVFTDSTQYGGVDFQTCLMKIMFNTDN